MARATAEHGEHGDIALRRSPDFWQVPRPMSSAGRPRLRVAGRLRRCDKSQLDGVFPPASLAEVSATLRALAATGTLPRDAEGRLLWPRLRASERQAIKLAAGRPYRTGRRLRGELLALQFVAARAVRPDLSIVDLLEGLAVAH